MTKSQSLKNDDLHFLSYHVSDVCVPIYTSLHIHEADSKEIVKIAVLLFFEKKNGVRFAILFVIFAYESGTNYLYL